MQEKTYRIRLNSPMGVKQGSARVRLQEGRIVLELLGGQNQFRGDFVPEYSFQMSGTLQTAVSELAACLRSTLSETGLRAVLHTESGDFLMEGVPEEDAGTR